MYHGQDIQRFFVLETVARVPYFAYVSCLHLYETLGNRDNTQRLRLHYAEADNELHHLLIMEVLGGGDAYPDRFFAQHLAFFYYFYCVAIFMLHPRAAYHLSELIEEHAFHTYDAYLEAHADELRKQPVPDIAREYYGGRDSLEVYFRNSDGELPQQSPRELQNLYDVFAAIRDDEGAHWRTLHNLVQHDDWIEPKGAAKIAMDIHKTLDTSIWKNWQTLHHQVQHDPLNALKGKPNITKDTDRLLDVKGLFDLNKVWNAQELFTKELFTKRQVSLKEEFLKK